MENKVQKNGTTNKSNKSKNPREALKRKEAAARRKIAKNWTKIEKGVKYQKATTQVCCRRVTLHLKEELFDGMRMKLREKYCEKSSSVQKRILRRIVEKRQAQQTHHNIERTGNLFPNYISRHCTSKSMKTLRLYQPYSPTTSNNAFYN